MNEKIKKILFNEEQIKNRVKELGRQITLDYHNKNLIMISILKGSVIFISDLMRAVDLDMKIDFMSISTYNGGIKSSGVVKISKDLDINIANYDVLIVEDIIDSGLTLSYIRALLIKRNPSSIKIVTLLDKVDKRNIDIKADYVGFNVPDEFVIGYGFDYDENFRNLPYIAAMNL